MRKFIFLFILIIFSATTTYAARFGNVEVENSAGGFTTVGNILINSDTSQLRIGSTYPMLMYRSGTAGRIDCPSNFQIRCTGNNSITVFPNNYTGTSPFEFIYTASRTELGFGVANNGWEFMGSATYDQCMFVVHDNYGNQFILSNEDNKTKDYDHAVQTNPTFYVHSDTDPDTDNTQYISMTHNKVDAVLTSGKGGIIQTAPAIAPTLTTNSQYSVYIDEAGGNLKFTVKYSDGTAKTATVAFD